MRNISKSLLSIILYILFLNSLFADNNNHVLNLHNKTIVKYYKIYGKKATLRLNYLIKLIDEAKKLDKVQKIYKVNKIVNKALHFAKDKRIWERENYLSYPLSTIGMGYADTEDIAFLKMLLLIKLGIDHKKLKLIQKNSPFIYKIYRERENVVLGYFDKKGDKPIVLDHKMQNGKRLYRLKDQFQYKIFYDFKSEAYKKVSKENFSINSIDKLFNTFDTNYTY